MKDPKRLVEDCGSELELMLLQEGRRSFSDEARRVKVLGALGVGTALAVSSKTGWAFATTWKKALVGSLAVCAGVGGSVFLAQNASAPSVPAAPSAQLALPQGAGPNLSPVTGQAAAVPVVGPEVVVPEVVNPSQQLDLAQQQVDQQPLAQPQGAAGTKNAQSIALGREPGAGHNSATRTPSLAQEVAAIDQARAAVRSGQGVQALGLVEDYLREFPKGGLRLEAEVVRVQALASLGKRAEASARAQKLLARNPNSVLAGRLRGYVVE